jgi:hypothetical protein
MFVTLLAVLAKAVVVPPAPSLSGGTVSHLTAGACNGVGGVSTPAQLQVSWGVANPDAVNYSIKIYENSVFQSTISGSSTTYAKTITGYVEDTSGGRSGTFTSNWTYRVDLVRLSDGVVVSSVTTAAWQQLYGDCTL